MKGISQWKGVLQGILSRTRLLNLLTDYLESRVSSEEAMFVDGSKIFSLLIIQANSENLLKEISTLLE